MEEKSKEIVYITKRLQFSSAHSLKCSTFTAEENEATYGSCVPLHGHNYVVKVTLRGPIDPKTGFFINVRDLKSLMQQCIMKPLDHTNVDDIPYFKERVSFFSHYSTGENIAVFIWKQLAEALGDRSSFLFEISLDETENNTFVYRGERTNSNV